MNKIADVKPKTEFGKWMLKNLLDRDWNCTIVARKLHTTRQSVSNHVSGRVRPNYPFVLAYCHIFGNEDDPEEIWKLVKNEGA